MRTEKQLGYDLIAVEHEETVHALIELTAPAGPNTKERSPATLQVVLDRSGSMGAGRLVAALQAIDSLVARLHHEDRLGLVIFDTEVAVPVPVGPVGDGSSVRRTLAAIPAGATTNLSGGLLCGIQEAQRAADGDGATLVLLSDGHANEGVIDHGRLEQFAAGAQSARITSSTIGIGPGETRRLLLEIDVPALGELGLAKVCELELRWVDLASMQSQVATIPVSINVVPGDEAAALRTPASRPSSRSSAPSGPSATRPTPCATATSTWRVPCTWTLPITCEAPSPRRHAMPHRSSRTRPLLEYLAGRAQHDAMSVRKQARADYHMKARRRGRRAR